MYQSSVMLTRNWHISLAENVYTIIDDQLYDRCHFQRGWILWLPGKMRISPFMSKMSLHQMFGASS